MKLLSHEVKIIYAIRHMLKILLFNNTINIFLYRDVIVYSFFIFYSIYLFRNMLKCQFLDYAKINQYLLCVTSEVRLYPVHLMYESYHSSFINRKGRSCLKSFKRWKVLETLQLRKQHQVKLLRVYVAFFLVTRVCTFFSMRVRFENLFSLLISHIVTFTTQNKYSQ